MKRFWRLGFAILFATSVYAQSDVVARARQLAIGGYRAEAIRILEQRLAETPDDVDARTLLGTVLSWDGQYARARGELQQALARDPNNADAKAALANVEKWSGRPRPARAEVMLGANYDHYADSGPWREAYASLKTGPASVPLVLRAARAKRFGLERNQFEAEAYPKFGGTTYAYLAAGFSQDSLLYPKSRYGAELFHTFRGGWEVSAGGRRLNFTIPVNLYTASVGKYVGDWLITARGYKATGTSSAQLILRRYFGAPGQYFGIRAGRGTTRDEIRSSADVNALDVDEIAAETLLVLENRWLVNARAGAGRALHGRGNTSTATLAFGVRF